MIVQSILDAAQLFYVTASGEQQDRAISGEFQTFKVWHIPVLYGLPHVGHRPIYAVLS